jgi:hypothetical protein
VRAYSSYLWARRNGLEAETFEHALELEEERDRYLPEALRYARPFSSFSCGPRAIAERLRRLLEVALRPDLAVQLEP